MKNRFPSLVLMLTLLLGLASCNQNLPADRGFIELAGQTDGDDDVDDGKLARPSGAVFFNQDTFCGCNNGKNILISNNTCNNICATQHPNTLGVDTLYVTFTLGAEVELEPRLGSARAWCETPLDDGQPVCVVKVQSSDGGAAQQIDNLNFTGPNSLSINISQLGRGKAYLLSLFETTSSAKSDALQLVRPPEGTGDPGGILAPQPVSQYSCVNRVLQTTASQVPDAPSTVEVLAAFKQHFYFIDSLRPDPVGQNPNMFCHNKDQVAQDSETLPRLEEQTNALYLWADYDTRFQMDNGNTAIDKRVWTELRELGVNISATTQFFGKLTVSRGANVTESGNINTPAALGWYMRTFIDTTDPARPIAYCPTQAHYEGSDKLFQVLGQYLQTDTEGIYLARRESAYYTPTGSTTQKCLPDDLIIVRESDASQAWFYLNTQRVPVRPTTVSELRNNTILFYYPYNFVSPTVRQSNQKLYTVITPGPNALRCVGEGGIPETTNTTAYNSTSVPHDKRFGCVPKP